MTTIRRLLYCWLFIHGIACNESSAPEYEKTTTENKHRIDSAQTAENIVLENFSKDVIIPFESYQDSIDPKQIVSHDTLVLINSCNLVLKTQLLPAYVTAHPNIQGYFRNDQMLEKLSMTNSELKDAIEQTHDMIEDRDKWGNSLKWPSPSVIHFSICKNSFPTSQEYEAIKQYMLEAARDWSALTRVELRYLPAYDNIVSFDNSAAQFPAPVGFVVVYQRFNEAIFRSPSDFARCLAVAFNREFPIPLRIVRICPGYFNPGRESKAGILRHEIGHIMGFRHEFISADASPDCPKEDFGMARPLTDYDPNSVMNYACGSFNNFEYRFTSKDISGIKSIYR